MQIRIRDTDVFSVQDARERERERERMAEEDSMQLVINAIIKNVVETAVVVSWSPTSDHRVRHIE